MRLQFGGKLRLLMLAIFSCLCVQLASSEAQAVVNPSVGGTTTIQKVTPAGGGTTYQIKGAGSVINLPPATKSVTVQITFQKKANGAANFVDLLVVTQVTTAVNGTATFDTGFQDLAAAPAAGDVYRIKMDATYTTANGTNAIPGTYSQEISP